MERTERPLRGSSDAPISPGALPGVLREIADVVGVEAAVRIAELCGGARLFIPTQVKPDWWLARAIGEDKAKAIARHFTSGDHSQNIEIPLGETGAAATRRRALCAMIAEGVPNEEIARRLRITTRSVRRNKARLAGKLPPKAKRNVR